MFTPDEADKMQAEWKERASKYKSRRFDNVNQQAIEDYLVSGIVAWGEEGIGAYHRLILEKGEWFIGRALVNDYVECKQFKKSHRPKMKECFHNSQLFVSLMSGTYYEGFMCDGFISVMHGWVVMPDNKVVDFTLEARDKHLRTINAPREGVSITDVAYLGVAVPTEFVREKILELEYCAPLAHMYHLKDDKRIWV